MGVTYSDGTIRRHKRRDGTWVWQTVITATEDGKKRQLTRLLDLPCDPPTEGEGGRGRRSTPTGRGARQALAELRSWRDGLVAEAEAVDEARVGQATTEDARAPVPDFVRRYWATRGVEPTTMDGYRGLLRHIDHPALSMPVGEVSTRDVRAWLEAKASEGTSDNTLRKAVDQLDAALKWGVAEGMLPANPCAPLKKPRRSHGEPNPLDEGATARLVEEVEATREYVTEADDGYEMTRAACDAVLVALHTGLRIGELCGLRWDDIDGGLTGELDAAKGNIHVNRTAATSPAKGGRCLKAYPKNGDRRDVPLNDALVGILERRRVEFAEVGDLSGAFVFARPSSATSLPSPEYLGKRASVLIASARVRGVQGTRITFHDLRHTFATRALAAGVDVVTVAGILGHRNTSTTLKYYARWLPSTRRDAMRRMGEVMSA